MRLLLITFMLLLACWSNNKEGEWVFKKYCKVCHHPIQKLVGPSIKEIRTIYTKKNQDKMIAWIKKPGKKRANFVSMPPMAFLGERQIKKVTDYLLELPLSSLKNKQKVKQKKQDKKVTFINPIAEPIVRRLFIHQANPDAFFIKLANNKYLCFEPRFAKAVFIYRGKLKIQEPYQTFKSKGKIISLNKELIPNKKIKFLGYSVENDNVFINYSSNNKKIALLIKDNPKEQHSFSSEIFQ